MGNLGWAEIAVIVVVALVVLGPEKLPGAARQIGQVMRQLRRISTGFQQELQNALDEPVEAEARRRGELAVKQSAEAGERVNTGEQAEAAEGAEASEQTAPAGQSPPSP